MTSSESPVILGQDWQKARDRLARTAKALEEGDRLSPERARAVLEERARALARVPPQAPAAADVVEVLVLTLANERYAIETSHLREVLRFQEFTPLPQVPDFCIGITNLRGQILPLFDLRKFFGVAAQEATEHSRIVVLGGERGDMGLLADAVLEVARLRTDEVLEPPGSMAGAAREFVRGVTENALIVLDGGVLLKDPRLVIDQGEDSGLPSREVEP